MCVLGMAEEFKGEIAVNALWPRTGMYLWKKPICWILIYCLRHSRVGAATAKSLQSCPTLCNPIDGSPPGSAVPGILQARTLEWVAISFSNAWKWQVKVKLLSHVRLSDPMDCSPPGSSIHGDLQARVLEWGAIKWSHRFPLRSLWDPWSWVLRSHFDSMPRSSPGWSRVFEGETASATIYLSKI